ncbi:MAG: substrate-binding periplasmic protein [Bdellovibrionales bacterium]
MKLANLLLVVALSAVTAFAVSQYAVPQQTVASTQQKESRFEQIKRTGTLRCGYYLWPPLIDKDLKTGQMKGAFVEITEEIAKQLGVKVEWVTEILHPNISVDFASNRYDMIGGILLATPSRAREMDFTIPIFFHPTYLFVRNGDTRFDNNYAAANDPKVKISVLEGEFSAIAANERYPKAQKIALPQNASGPEILLSVAAGKADVVATEMTTFSNYSKNNPGILRRVAGPPESVVAAGFPIPQREQDLKDAVDTTITYLQSTGFIDKVFRKYETQDNKILRMTSPYILQ